MKILLACEFSGTARDAFIAQGHEAWSCDLLPCERSGPHLQEDIRDVLDATWMHWDMMIAFPPCTHLAASGARWFRGREREQREAIAFFLMLAHVDIPRVAIENPVGVISTRWRRPDQIIQPWQFGHGETKATCLWLKGLPLLTPTRMVRGRHGRVWREPPSPDRWKNRSRTYQGIAEAMAEQWGADKGCGVVDSVD